MPKFKNNLKYYREKYGLSQEDISNKIGIPQTTLSRYETGERKISSTNLIRLSKLFKVSPEYLLNSEELSTDNAIIKTKDDLRKAVAYYVSVTPSKIAKNFIKEFIY